MRRRSPSACSSRSATRATSRRWPTSCGGGSRRARRRLARGRARVPRVRARLDDRDRRLPRAGARAATSRRSRSAAREAGLPEPLVMRSSGGVATLAEAAAHPAFALLSGPGRRRRRRGDRARGSAGFERRDLVRHGRHVDRRRLIAGGDGRALRASATSPGFPSGCRASTCTPSAPAAARSRGSTRAAPCASGPRARAPSPGRPATGSGGTRPTVTDANLLLGRLPEQLAGGLELDREAAERALGDIDPADGRRAS